jgi:glycosyltransferase involved in cell wall biosynthesis
MARRAVSEFIVPDLAPVRLLDIEIGQALPDVLGGVSSTGRRYERALALVRLHTFPLGMVELPLPEAGLGAAAWAAAIWQALHDEINAHLGQDGLPPASGFEAAGIVAGASGSDASAAATPRCQVERAEALAQAPSASIVIATRERPESLALCLRSAAALDYPQFEVIVVDNAPSSGATAALVRALQGDMPHLHYAREDRPGLSWARNCGVRAAEGQMVAITDDDVVLDPHWLAELARGFAAGPQVGCVTGHVLPRELDTPAQVLLEQFGGYSKGFARRLFDTDGHRPPGDPLFPYSAGRLGTGSNIAFPRSLLCELGGFDPALGAGTPTYSGEEFFLFARLIKRGYQLAYEPAALLFHSHPRRAEQLPRQVYGYAVGLTAYLTRYVLEDPSAILDIAGKVPAGLRYQLDPRSHKNRNRGTDYPRALARLELDGMLRGPLAYLRSRRANRRLLRPGDLTGSTSPVRL